MQLFKGRATDQAMDLIAAMLTYEPTKRITAAAALLHPFFDELRQPTTRLPDGEPLPPLFNFTDEEVATLRDRPGAMELLVPPHARTPLNWKGAAAAAGGAGIDGAAVGGAGAGSAKPVAGGAGVASASSAGAAAGTSRESRASDATLSSPKAAAAAPAGAGAGLAKHHTTVASAGESAAASARM